MLDHTYVLFVVFFFFQAEDGIRDADVTGVQTCALPIYVDPLRDVLLIRTLPGRGAAVREGPAAHGAQRRAARGHDRRHRLTATRRPARNRRGLGRRELRRRPENLPLALGHWVTVIVPVMLWSVP